MSAYQEELADRFKAHLAYAGVPDPDTGTPLPITIGDLYRRLEHRYETVVFSKRHLLRLAAGETWPRLDTLWMLAEQFNIHPALLLGQDRPTPTAWPDLLAPTPIAITAPLTHALQLYVSVYAVPGTWTLDRLYKTIIESPHCQPARPVPEEELDGTSAGGRNTLLPEVSRRHIDRLLQGTALPRLNTIYALSDALGVPATDLAFGPDEGIQ